MGECAKEINLLLSISIDVKRMIKKLSQLLTKQNTIVTTANSNEYDDGTHYISSRSSSNNKRENISNTNTHFISNAMFTMQTQILHAQRIYHSDSIDAC